MISPALLLYIYLAAVLSLGSGVALFLFLRRRARRGEVWRSLNLQLFKIALPQPHIPEGGLSLEQTREAVATMEKIYANLHGIREGKWRSFLYGQSSFSLEIAVPHVGEEIAFYLAVPRRLASAVEKIITGVYPEARVEMSPDYNLFNPTGVAAGAVCTLSSNAVLPIKTYRALEADPLRELANAFSKIAREGEGAALQVVARPAPKQWSKRISSHARLVYQGKASLRPKGVLAESMEILGGAARAGNTKPGEPKPEIRLSPKEEEQVRLMETKSSKPLFEANIRIVASAASPARAGEIAASIASAFLQFRDPGLNEFKVRSVTGRKLSRLLYQFSFRLFDGRGAAVLSSEELTGLFHFPSAPLETPKLGIVKAKEAPPPANLPESGIRLGASVFRGETRAIKLTDDDRRRHLYIIGQTGTGKSSLMTEMLRQDILAGRGVCFIDPHGDTAERVLGYVPPERAGDVIYFNPGDTERPMGLNMLEYDPAFPEQKTMVVNELFAIFQKLYGAVPEALGPMFEQYFRNSTLLVMDDPASGNTLLEIERIFTDKTFRDLKLSRSKNVVVETFWREIAEKAGGEASLANMVPYITSKFDTFLANEIMRPIVAQERSAFSFREVMDNGKILVINLSKGRLGELNSSLIGLIMVGKLLLAALSRTNVDESARRDFYLYIDEFQNATTNSIATILSEARKYRLGLIIAHQFLSQLTDDIKKAVFGNVGSMVAFRIGSDDAEFMATQFAPVFGAQDLLNIDNYNAYLKLLINGQTSQPFNIRISPPAPSDRAMAERVKEHSRLTYGRPRPEVEAEINLRYQKPSSFPPMPTASAAE